VSTDAEVRRQLYAELREYEQAEVAEVGARVRRACSTARPGDAELQALVVIADVLRLHHRGGRHRDLTLALLPSRILDDARDDD
jgi:GAF domain-containing protein